MAAMAAMIRKRNDTIDSARKAKEDDDKRRNAAQALSMARLRRRQEEGRALLLRGSAAAEEAHARAMQAHVAESAVVDALERQHGDASGRQVRVRAGARKVSKGTARTLKASSTRAGGARSDADGGLPLAAAVRPGARLGYRGFTWRVTIKL